MKMSALLVAACKGHDKIIQLLLQSNKVDINQKSTEVIIYSYCVCDIYLYVYNGLVFNILQYTYYYRIFIYLFIYRMKELH